MGTKHRYEVYIRWGDKSGAEGTTNGEFVLANVQYAGSYEEAAQSRVDLLGKPYEYNAVAVLGPCGIRVFNIERTSEFTVVPA